MCWCADLLVCLCVGLLVCLFVCFSRNSVDEVTKHWALWNDRSLSISLPLRPLHPPALALSLSLSLSRVLSPALCTWMVCLGMWVYPHVSVSTSECINMSDPCVCVCMCMCVWMDRCVDHQRGRTSECNAVDDRNGGHQIS
jgi:hypothetical protein